MATRYTIALLGFSEFERSALTSYFRLAKNRTPRYHQLQVLDDADFLVADADHPASVQLVQATDRTPVTVFIGARPPSGCMAWVNRPIDGLQVLRELDALLAQTGRQAPLTALLPSADVALPRLQFERRRTGITGDGHGNGHGNAAGPDSGNDDDAQPTAPDVFVPDPSAILLEPAYAPHGRATPQPRHAAPAREPPAPAAAAPAAPAWAAAEPVFPVEPALPQADVPLPTQPPQPAPQAMPLPMPAPSEQARALLVDDSDIALRFLQLRLQRWGLHTDLASNSAQAQALLAAHSYDLVFLDVELGTDSDLGGMDLCQLIKQSPSAVQTTVVLVSAHHSELDRVRGALAGCDAYLGKPLEGHDLERLLQRHGLKPSPTAA